MRRLLTHAGRKAASALTVVDGVPPGRRSGDPLDSAGSPMPSEDGRGGTGVRRPGHHRNG